METDTSHHPAEAAMIADIVASGRFADEQEVMRAGLRMLYDYESTMKMGRLKELIAQGDADIAANRTTQIHDARAFAEQIIAQGE